MKKIIISLLLMAAPVALFAQLKVNSDGNVCIVKETPFGNSFLSVGNFNGISTINAGISSQMNYPSASGTRCFGSFNLALSGTNNNAQTIGVMGVASNGYSGKLYGVLGAIPSTKVGAGIYGTTGGSGSVFGKLLSAAYAGYFEGATYVDGTLTATEVITPSDIRLKENIISITEEETDSGGTALENLMDMNVLKYTYKPQPYIADMKEDQLIYGDETSALQAEETSKQEIQRMSEQRHYGLSAQELQKLYPDLVREAQDGTLGINYIELVPILIRSIQELKQELDKSIESGSRMTRSAFSDDEEKVFGVANNNVLYQNTPNPFKEQTTIRFSLADDARDAAICIFDMTGKMLKKLPISSGETSVKVNGWELGEGMFLYTLMVNGREVDTKRMIITK